MRPKKIFLFAIIFLIFIFHAWGLYSSAYYYVWWLDNLLHLAGGFWLGLLAIYFISEQESDFNGYPEAFLFLIIISFSALGGILWEFFEFGLDTISINRGLMLSQLGVADTMSDLFLDISGAFAASLLLRISRKNLI